MSTQVLKVEYDCGMTIRSATPMRESELALSHASWIDWMVAACDAQHDATCTACGDFA